MGANKHKTKNRLPPFVLLFVGTIDAPAWGAMSHGAKWLSIALWRRYRQTTHNNGRIYLSQRQAAEELSYAITTKSHVGSAKLQHYGFIVMTMPRISWCRR